MSSKASLLIRSASVPYVKSIRNILCQDARQFSCKDAGKNDGAKTQLINQISGNLTPLVNLLCPEGSDANGPTLYDSRKYSPELPKNTVNPLFPTLVDIPKNIFRCTEEETLGLGAYKGGPYQNPEYFSFHDMTFYDMNLYLHPYRRPVAKTKRTLKIV